MRVYVAGRFGQYEDVRAAIDRLAEVGHECTHDWTRTSEFGSDGHPKLAVQQHGADLTSERQRHHAQLDLSGVQEADAVVLLAYHDGMCGALIEIGYTLVRGLQVVVIAPKRWTIFYSLTNVTVWPTLESWIEFVAEFDGKVVAA